jgi:hypothetical protein
VEREFTVKVITSHWIVKSRNEATPIDTYKT